MADGPKCEVKMAHCLGFPFPWTRQVVRTAVLLVSCAWLVLSSSTARATPANRIGMERYFARFLTKKLDNCTTCHLPLGSGRQADSLANFPHNPFGRRLAEVGERLRSERKRSDIASRLRLIANEDSDGDGVDNLSEILLDHSPGDRADVPSLAERKRLPRLQAAFRQFVATYRWQPFESVHRPEIPTPRDRTWRGNPIDAFLAVERENRGLRPRPEAPRATLLRRVTLDLNGLSPTPSEIRAFLADRSPDAYEHVVNRLLASPRYGEQWGRHWMDVWRYSDWAGWADGNQIRDSKPFIWRWRDWIVESLNVDKGYDRMAQEMLAADELCPEDPDSLRATGFLVRNFKLLSREQWLEDTLNHTSRAFLGLTMHCAKCHNHMYDPITQADYYHMRAIFEPHNVRTDRVPGQPDTTKDGLVRAFDAEPAASTYLFVRGDERNPDKTRAISPGVPGSLGADIQVTPVNLPAHAFMPDRRAFVVQETIAASAKAVSDAETLVRASRSARGAEPAELILKLRINRARYKALLAVLAVEDLEEAGKKGTDEWARLARGAEVSQRQQAVAEAEGSVASARTDAMAAQTTLQGLPLNTAKDAKAKAVSLATAACATVDAAEKALEAARAATTALLTTQYTPRPLQTYPAQSTGRRLAFARWLTDPANPLTARVAVNHIWARHFGQGIVPSVSDFGRNGRAPTHPKLLDWLAAEFMSKNWRMKDLHRLIVTSRAYRMSSSSEAVNEKIDPDDALLWRYPSRRMEAENVRDNILYASGHLDETRGGPEIDHTLDMTSLRRSIYLQTAAEKQSEFVQVFDGPSVTECYERRPTVMPQQALALANSELTRRESGLLAAELTRAVGSDDRFFTAEAFLRILARPATGAEIETCRQYLAVQVRTPGGPAGALPAPVDAARDRARRNLVLVLFNHNDFVTVR